MQILVLTDNKKGHENQSIGLAEALLRRRQGEFTLHSIQDKAAPTSTPPDLVIGAGHRTHGRLLRLAKQFRCPSVVIMKPTMPLFLFSHCLVPEHDLQAAAKTRPNVIVTKGALNRIPEEFPPKQAKGLIMIGGPSKHFDWELAPVMAAIQSLVTSQPGLRWTVGDSRRTPASFLNDLLQKDLPLTVAPHQECGGNWLRDEMLASQSAWITPDSTSMLFEALTAGCRLGTLPLPPQQTRLSHAHELLASQGWLTPFLQHDPSLPLPEPPGTLHETARCAEILLPKILL